MKSLLLLFVFLTINILSQNSSYYLPLNIQKAYSNGTRNIDGAPGENYWVNYSNYKIEAEVDPDSSFLKGKMNVVYYNNSPDTLHKLILRLYQNINQKGSARNFSMNGKDLHDGVEIYSVAVNGNKLNLGGDGSYSEVNYTATNMIVPCKDFLNPSGSISIDIEWGFYIPKINRIRMGNYGDGDMFIAYWYPQVSVYDDIDGWDLVEYYGMVEFYNDINNYDVKITLPAKYAAWATGDLQNSSDIFTDEINSRIKKAHSSDEVIRIITREEMESGGVILPSEKHTWHFVAESVPDFSFCFSDSYVWDAASVEVEPGRRVLTDAVFEEGAIHYDSAAFYARASVEYMSFELPGIPFPYSHMTTFCNKQRGGGMETPMMANNGAPRSAAGLAGLIFHENAHTYFPFMMGINERKYAWMDEGWASFFPTSGFKLNDGEDDFSSENRVRGYLSDAGKEKDLPLMVLSYSNLAAARNAAYNRPAIAYNELMKLLGRDLFRKALHQYITQWKGKHPIPYDFFFTFDKIAGEDLSWFWKPWFFDYGYPDLAVESAKISGDEIFVVIKKAGNIPTELVLTFNFEDGTEEKITESAGVWKKGNSEHTVKFKPAKKIKSVVIGDKEVPDLRKSNNTFVFE